MGDRGGGRGGVRMVRGGSGGGQEESEEGEGERGGGERGEEGGMAGRSTVDSWHQIEGERDNTTHTRTLTTLIYTPTLNTPRRREG